MAFLRVLAKMIDDGEHNEDLNTKLVFHLKVDDSNHVDLKMESFGYNECWEIEQERYVKYPFILIDSGIQGKRCKLSYEGGDDVSNDLLNLDSKEIREGVTFTYFECSFDPPPESVYRIESVRPL